MGRKEPRVLSQRTMSGSAVSNHVDGAYCPVPSTQVGLSKWPVPGEEPLVGRKYGHEEGHRRPDHLPGLFGGRASGQDLSNLFTRA